MYGAQIGTLNVYIKSDGTTRNVFTNQGNTNVATQQIWLYHSYTVTNTLKWSVIFEGMSKIIL